MRSRAAAARLTRPSPVTAPLNQGERRISRNRMDVASAGWFSHRDVHGASTAALQALPGVLRVEPFGSAHHVSVEAASLSRALDSLRSMPGVEAEPTTASLEDVFMAVA